MFSSKTLFILGAGASYPYGYPLGKALIRDILDDMNDDVLIFKYNSKTFPLSWNENDEENGYFYDLNNFKDNLTSLETINRQNLSKSDDNSYYYNGRNLFKTKIKNIKQFRELKESLVALDPVSIDAFLRDNPHYAIAGKSMIIYSLLKRENQTAFNIKQETEDSCDNWYTLLFNDMVSHCAENPDSLLQNKLTIITFNYDMSLEFFLYNALSRIEIFSKSLPNSRDSIGMQFFQKLKINHVYGALYEVDKLSDYGTYAKTSSTGINSSGSPSPRRSIDASIITNFERFIFSLSSYANIKTMYDERNNQSIESYKQNLFNTDEIIFIGFGFDRDNLYQLGFPDILDDYLKLFKDKSITIRYLNYKGRMKSLDQEFEELQKAYNNSTGLLRSSLKIKNPNSKLKIISSSANSISSAYLNPTFRTNE